VAELTDKQQAFVMHYLVCLNGAEAARRAGYPAASARQVASENLSKPVIRAAIDAALADAAMPASEVLARLTEHARASMEEFITVRKRTVSLDLKAAKERGVLHLVKKYTKTNRGVSLELYDAQTALTTLGKYHRLFGDDGGILKYLDLSKLSPEQLQRIADGDDPLAVLLNTTETAGPGPA
jgi:phage terminase small subunit